MLMIHRKQSPASLVHHKYHENKDLEKDRKQMWEIKVVHTKKKTKEEEEEYRHLVYTKFWG